MVSVTKTQLLFIFFIKKYKKKYKQQSTRTHTGNPMDNKIKDSTPLSRSIWKIADEKVCSRSFNFYRVVNIYIFELHGNLF